jgi:hypothetical protein
VFDGAAMTHTAAILNPAPVKPETMAKAAQIAEKSLEREEKKVEIRGIDPALHPEIIRRTVAGQKPKEIADAIGCEVKQLYFFNRNHKQEIKRAAKKDTSWAEGKPEPLAPKVAKKTKTYEPSSRGGIMSQVARLFRGEIRTAKARSILISYRGMLEYDLKESQSKTKDIKHSLGVVDEALRELDVIQQGEKAVVEKVLAAVK